MKVRMTIATMVAILAAVLVGCSQENITAPPVESQDTLAAETDLVSGEAAEVEALGPNKTPSDRIPGQYIIQFRGSPNDVESRAKALARDHGFELGHVYRHALQGFAAKMSSEVADRVAREADILEVAPDMVVRAVAQTLPSGVDRIDTELSPVAVIDGAPTQVDVDIAIIDTGIDFNHPDLNVVGGARTIGGVIGPNFMDDNGHGTHVAGIAAARDNGQGVVGVAPGARLWGVKVLNAFGFGSTSDVILGIDWVTSNAADIEIANMSLAGTGWNGPYNTAVQNCVAAGVVVVVAAGNDAIDVYGADGTIGTGDDIVPAAFPDAATISALADRDGIPGGLGGGTSYGPDDSFASLSNYSNSVFGGNPVTSPGAAIDVMAPGIDIASTLPGNSYGVLSGTSMASPHAAGLYGLYIAANGRALNAAGVYAIRQAIIDNGAPQASPLGLAVANDPDPNNETIGWAVAPTVYGDVSILSFTATPTAVAPGGVLSMTVTLANRGNQNVTTPFTVRIREPNSGATLVSKTLPGLPQGLQRSGTVNFTVPASALAKALDVGTAVPPGFYTLRCSHNFADPRAYQNSQSIVVEVLAPAALGDVVINPDPDALDAPWSLTGPDKALYTGNGDSTLVDVPAGSYTVTWGAVPDWTAPGPETLTLAADAVITFNGVYTSNLGTVIVNPNPDAINAGWQLSGPGFFQSGSGDLTIPDLDPGEYQVIWLPVTGWIQPPLEVQTLTAGGTIEFIGDYTEIIGGDEVLGLFFDTAGTETCTVAAFLDHVTAYILYQNPTLATTRGFECGIDLAGGGLVTFNSSMTVSFPVPSTNVGTNTPNEGIYNYIVGFGTPIVTGPNTIMATLDLFYLDFASLDFFLRASIPSSGSGDFPMLIRDDFSLMEVDMAVPEGEVSIHVDMVSCAIPGAGEDSWDEVRNLFK